MYTINFCTGAGNLTAETLEEAVELARENACYTQANIVIEDENGDEVACSHWYGVKFNEDEDEECLTDFGDFGFYDRFIGTDGYYI